MIAILQEIKTKSKYLIPFLLIPLSEIKAIFYYSDLKIKSGILYCNYRYLCNVLEDYANVLIIGVLLFYLVKFSKGIYKEVFTFLFILNALDLLHLGLMDKQYILFVKLITAYILYKWIR